MSWKKFFKPNWRKIIISLAAVILFVFNKYFSIQEICKRVDCDSTGAVRSLFACCRVSSGEMMYSYAFNLIIPFVVVYLIYSIIEVYMFSS